MANICLTCKLGFQLALVYLPLSRQLNWSACLALNLYFQLITPNLKHFFFYRQRQKQFHNQESNNSYLSLFNCLLRPNNYFQTTQVKSHWLKSCSRPSVYFTYWLKLGWDWLEINKLLQCRALLEESWTEISMAWPAEGRQKPVGCFLEMCWKKWPAIY